MQPIHEQVLDQARRLAGADRNFRIVDVVRALAHLNPATVRTHVSSRCCINAPANHTTRHKYFRSIGRGVYRLQPQFVRLRQRRQQGWQDAVIAALGTGVDSTQIVESLKLTPTQRLDAMRQAAASLDGLLSRT